MKKYLVSVLFALFIPCALWAAEAKNSLPDELEDVMLMNVARIEVIKQYEMRNDAPYIDPQMPTPLTDALATWAEKSFVATGEEGVMKIIIKEASLQESHYEDEPRFFGLFPGKRMDKYLATAVVQMKLYNAESLAPRAETEATATREGRIESAAGVGYRHDLFRTMSADLITDIGQQSRELTYKFFHEKLKE